MQHVGATIAGCGQKYSIKESTGSPCSACGIWHPYIEHVEKTEDVSKFLEVSLSLFMGNS